MQAGPMIVGGVGGSGTRAVADYLQAAGLFIGEDLNQSLDALPFVSFLDAFVPRWLEHSKEGGTGFPFDQARDAWRVCRDRHLDGRVSMRWAAKNPRSLLMFEFVLQVEPGARFLHVVRDGFDMAFSSNQRQASRYADQVLDSDSGLSEKARSLAYWAAINQRAITMGARYPGRYQLIRYEDFCAHPVNTMRSACEKLGMALEHGRPVTEKYVRSARSRPQDWPQVLREAPPESRRLMIDLGYPC